MYRQLLLDIENQGFHIINHFLPANVASCLQKTALELYQDKLFKSAKIGQLDDKQLQNEVRRDAIFWLDPRTENFAIKSYFDRIDSIKQALNQHFFLGLRSFETHFALYSPGAFYKKHRDQFQGNQDRQISCVYYLNPEWQSNHGGMLSLFDEHQQIIAEVPPSFNLFVCFRSHILHEVQETHKTRLSIAGWLKQSASL